MVELIAGSNAVAYTRVGESSNHEQLRRADTAGELVQLVTGTSMGHIAYIEFLSGSNARPRGNHYHPEREEWMYIIAGRLRASFYDNSSGKSATHEFSAGDMIFVSPGCGHVYEALEYSQAVEMSPQKRYDGDTVKQDVLQLVHEPT